ncbi:exonuclease 1 [Epargyreus clarus]|uniref:exonuclease 1 n=1 Tax=Epargyreus clarus TaxID=520877 RepID=UPI003C2F2E5D
MGITGLIPFIEKASRRININEFSGSTVAVDTYCWLHKGAFACAEKLVRGEETDIHIRYCLKYVTMLLSKNIKPILVFDGRHLPAKALTESKRRESRDTSKKRAAELLSLGKIEEARSYIRRSVDITHEMALALIKECRKRNVDCIVAPYEADAQLAYLNIKNIAQLVVTEDSDLILFGCTKVLFKMDLDGAGTLVETIKLPLVMKCPIEHYTFDKFRQMCIMSGCDYLASLPGIGLAKARQFVTTTQDSNFANALRKLPGFFNKSSLTVTDEYRENFLKAEATFKHQYVYDPIERRMVRLTEPDDDDVEKALCVNAGELLDSETAFELALGNLNPFTLKVLDNWHPDHRETVNGNVKTSNWKDKGISTHPSIWDRDFTQYTSEDRPWVKRVKKVEPIIAAPQTRLKKKVVNLVTKYVPETQDESLTIEKLSSMYCTEPATKKQRFNCDSNEPKIYNQNTNNPAFNENEVLKTTTTKAKSPILENKERSFRKCLKTGSYSVLKRLSRFPRTVLDEHVIESNFFNGNSENSNDQDSICVVEESPEKSNRKDNSVEEILEIDTNCSEYIDSGFSSSQKENSPQNSPVKVQTSPILEPSPKSRNPFKIRVDENVTDKLSQDSVIENTQTIGSSLPTVDSEPLFDVSPPSASLPLEQFRSKASQATKKSTCKVPGLKRTASLPSNQPTLLSKFGFQKKPVLRR